MRKVIKSSKRIKRKRMFDTFSIFLCIFLAFYVLFGKISQLDRFLIKEIEITGNNIIKKSEIFNIIKKETSGRYLSMFPKNNFLLYPKKNIEKIIYDKFLRLEDILLENENIFKLSVAIKERTPGFIWCPKKNNDCFYMDNKGLIFDHAPDFSEGVFLKFQGGIFNNEKPDDFLGKILIETGTLEQIIKFKNESEAIIRKNLGGEWFASSISIMEWDDFSIQISGKNNKVWKLIFVGKGVDVLPNLMGSDNGILKTTQESNNFSLETNLMNMARNLEATILSEDFKINFNKPNSNIDYIDLRFGKKVFYRFKE